MQSRGSMVCEAVTICESSYESGSTRERPRHYGDPSSDVSQRREHNDPGRAFGISQQSFKVAQTTDIMGVSGRRMIEATIERVHNLTRLAELADTCLKASP